MRCLLVMKRKKDLYKNIYNMNNILSAFNEVCKNTKNKNRIENFKEYKNIYISRVHKILLEKSYTVGSYNKFIIMSQKKDKL